jgi:hypothetical protein
MEDLLMRFYARKNEFSGRVNMLAEEYDNLIEHIPTDLDECCSIEYIPEPDLIRVKLFFNDEYELPPIVRQRIKEIFGELFPQGQLRRKKWIRSRKPWMPSHLRPISQP